MQAFEYFTKQSNFNTFEKYSTYLAGPFIMYIIGKHVKSKWVHHLHNDYCILRWTSWLYFLKLEIEILPFLFWCKTWVQDPYHFAVWDFHAENFVLMGDTLQRELHQQALKYNAKFFFR